MRIDTRAALAAGITLTAALAATAAMAQDRPPPVRLHVEECLRRNVDRVVAADRSLASAADFLVNYACAGEVAALARYQRNIAYIQIFAATAQPTQPAAPGAPPKPPPPPPPDPKTLVNPETGDLILPPAATGAPASPLTSLLPVLNGLFGQLVSVNAPPDLRKLAGDLVLAASERLQRR